MTKSEQKAKILQFIEQGNEIKSKEYHNSSGALSIPYISGPLFESWMNEIKIFNERYLKDHPLYKEINSTVFHHKGQLSSHKNMMGHLSALANDQEYWNVNDFDPIVSGVQKNTTNDDAKMAPVIFVSHRSEDAEVAEMLLDYFVSMGIPKSYIFCSSLPGNDVKQAISREIKEKMKNSSVNIVILSNNYYKSAYCLNEAGIVWLQDPQTPAIIVALPEINHTNMQGFLNSEYKLRRLDNLNDISAVFDTIQDTINVESCSLTIATEAGQKLYNKYKNYLNNRKIENSTVSEEEKQIITPLEEIKKLLCVPENWVEEDEKFYHSLYPKYTIVIEDESDESGMWYEGDRMFYHHLQTDTRAYYGVLRIFCNSTQLFSCQITHLDGHRMTAPCPESKFIPYRNYRENILLKYYTVDSLQYLLLKFLEFHIGSSNGQEAQWATRKLLDVVLLFDSIADVEEFSKYINSHLGMFDATVDKQRETYISNETDTAKKVLAKEIRDSLALKELQPKWEQFRIENI